MRSIVWTLLFAPAVSCALAGCQIATAYVPQTPGRATIGVERGAVGVYKNGRFERMGAPVNAMLACSPPAASAATVAADHETNARFNTTISTIGWVLLWVFPPTIGLGVGFGAMAERDRKASFAAAVDAVNLHNDTGACTAATVGGRS